MTNIDNQSPSSVSIMWVLFEEKPRAVKLKNDITQIPELDDLYPVLKKEFNELQDIERSDIEFFSFDDYHKLSPLRSGTLLTDIVTTDISPLVVRYPFSDTS
ncbi:2764_t:CDS:1, partial [Dentiscutata heterogama]